MKKSIIILLILSSYNTDVFSQWVYATVFDVNIGYNFGTRFSESSNKNKSYGTIGVGPIAVGLYKGFGLGTYGIEGIYFNDYGGESFVPLYFYKSLIVTEPKQGYLHIPWFLAAYTGGSLWATREWNGALRDYYKVGVIGLRNVALFGKDDIK